MTAPDILSSEYAEDPYPLLEELREDFPITYNEGLKSWVISRYEDVVHALKSPVFTTENYDWQLEPVHGRTIMQMEGPDHRRQRGIVTPTLRGDLLRKNFESNVIGNVEALIEPWRNDGHVDLVKQFTQKLPLSVILTVLGLRTPETCKPDMSIFAPP